MKVIRLLFLLFSLCFLLPTVSWATTRTCTADCGGTCSASSFQTSVNASSDGDTVILPAGSCTWSIQVNINKAITVQGAGIGLTNITHNYTCSSTNYQGAIVVTAIPSGSNNTRITGITFGSTATSGSTCVIGVWGGYSYTTKVRIDHCSYSCINCAQWLRWNNNQPGLFDNNYIPGDNDAEKMTFFGDSDASWARVDNFGSANLIYVEDNHFNEITDTPSSGATLTNYNGTRVVFRHNILKNFVIDSHGNWGDAAGCRQMELYNNDFYGSYYSWFDLKAGTGVVYSNTAHDSAARGVCFYFHEAYTAGDDGCCCRSMLVPDTNPACRQRVGHGYNYGDAPFYVWSNIGPGGSSLPIQVYENEGTGCDSACGEHNQTAWFIRSGIEYVDNGTTPKPGYTAYTYPHPLQGSAVYYTVTPSAGANGSILPNTPQSIASGSTTQFTVTPNSGYSASVDGTCGGSLVGTTYTTSAIIADCTVSATFTLIPAGITIGNAEILYTDAQMYALYPNFYMDGSFATVKKDANTMYFFASVWDTTYKFEGTMSAPMQTQVWAKSQGTLWTSMNGFAGVPWLYNIYVIDSTHWLGFIHREVNTGQPNVEFAIGLGYSINAGESWLYCGDIIRPQNINQNIGGVPYVVVGNYFYVYFNEWTTGGTKRISVARALISDVVTAAQSGTITTWYKYASGVWTQNGITGLGSNIITDMDSYYDTHADAAYDSTLGKYMLLLQTHGEGQLLLYTSTDGVTWGDRTVVDQVATDTQIQAYSTIASLTTGATDDCREVGASFYIIYPRKGTTWPSGYEVDSLYRRSVTVQAGGDPNPPTVSAFTIASTSNSRTVTVNSFVASDDVGVTGYLITESASTPSVSDPNWRATQTWTSTGFTISEAVGGNYVLYAWAKDFAGNISPSKNASVTITDIQAPTVTLFDLPLTYSGLTVPINYFTCSDNFGVTGYCVTLVNLSGGCTWYGSAPATVTVPYVGNNTVWAWCKDAAGNISPSANDSVLITAAPPDAAHYPVRGGGIHGGGVR
jgi:hypothetical protein